MKLPEAFCERIKKQLDGEYDAFLSSYQQPPSYGLRINPLKGATDIIASELPFVLSEVRWTKEGYHAKPAEHPGRHPLHEAGVYYIQEPSAMSVVSLLAPKPGELVCDLCAAPGGKSTQIAGRLLGQGLLVSNEIIPSRAKILSQNIERMGISNAVVCNEEPQRMAQLFPLFFDKIVVDAPCSGEGMFRKDEKAIWEWTPEQVAFCADRQQMILSCADEMLKPGGVLVYSTCTFAPEEDEEQICKFLAEHPDYILEDWKNYLAPDSGISSGSLEGTMRLWPHKISGEGHFAVRLRKTGTLLERQPSKHKKRGKTKRGEDYSDFLTFQEKTLRRKIADPAVNSLQFMGEELYLIPEAMRSLNGIKVLRPGLHLGTRKKNRLEPSHALSKVLTPDDVYCYYNCSLDEATRFLHGETLAVNQENNISLQGWTLVCYQNFPLGWAKASNQTLKNHYPKGLRINY